MEEYNNDLTVLINCLATTFGDEVGQAVNEKITELLALGQIDIVALQGQLTALNAALASNTEGDVLTAQSILTQLAALDSRLDVLEGSTAVAQLQATVASLQAAQAAAQQAAQDADAALQNNINGIQSALDALALQVTTIQNQTGGAECDCVALTAAIADQANAIANLQGVDAAQAAQIAALQTQVAALSVAGAQVAQAAADAAAALSAAQAAAASAAAAQATATAAAVSAASAQAAADAAATSAAGAVTNINNLKIEIQNVDCAIVGANFRTAMRGRLFGQAGGNGGN